jgi:hypothetical protein
MHEKVAWLKQDLARQPCWMGGANNHLDGIAFMSGDTAFMASSVVQTALAMCSPSYEMTQGNQ